ncbi:sigma-54 dependent transcriptional regulator [Aureisphaera galaxeae]|uniref:sigma-54-dependent transcriptional regulator n=1 Tax=Aureisphaera galaxeae TaxID=1538023 RepID=UPI00235096EC|nr:sigma-54 dependent transcriptional regulator [Aureisphaera galaxeae]MDC8002752.1 sigma-54 dependent transcriptional regulator [Aureisphaera galaxeae]
MADTILILEDDIAFLTMLSTFLERKGYSVEGVSSMAEAEGRLLEKSFSLLITDLKLPDGSGLSILEYAKEKSPSTQVILMTGYAEVSSAVKAIKKGALDYISKPFRPEELLMIMEQTKEVEQTPKKEKKTAPLPQLNDEVKKTNFVAGISEASKKFHQYLKLVGPTDMGVLIQGESGTGKEVAAQAIHAYSYRSANNFVAVDCGAIPKEIAASEFFGHVKGSFTGAVNDKKGHFEAAHGGTLFLDEVGNLSYENQVQLLRALQERKIKPVGSNSEIEVDVRIISATNEDLLDAVAKGNFREDLYHRLNEFSIQIPSLCERREDLFLYTEYFLSEANESLNKNILGLSSQVELAFKNYNWPGNLRELKNVLKRAVLLTPGSHVEIDAIPQEVVIGSEPRPVRNFSKSFNEKQLIINALEETGNNKSKAARLLNITRKTLYNKMDLYDLKL